jgi:hypothetical protein
VVRGLYFKKYSYSHTIYFYYISENYVLMMATLLQPKHVAVHIYYNELLCIEEPYSSFWVLGDSYHKIGWSNMDLSF